MLIKYKYKEERKSLSYIEFFLAMHLMWEKKKENEEMLSCLGAINL